MFRCTCGGEMVAKPFEEYLKESLATMGRVVPLKPPHHRKKRIRKKWAKRHAREAGPFLALAAFMVPVRRGVGQYRCASCGRRDGGYSFLARQLFSVEPMPPGALAIYGGEPDVKPAPEPLLTEAEKQALVEKWRR